MWKGVDALPGFGCDSAAMHTDPTAAQLVGQSIAKAVALAEQFDAAALRNHAQNVMGAAATHGSAMAFAAQLRDSLVAIAVTVERG